MKKAVLILMISITAMLSLAGCDGKEIKPGSSSSGTYATQTANSTIEYSLYMNKQITVFANQLTTRMTVIRNLQESSYENEIYLTEQSIKTLEDTLEEVTITMPSKDADDDREATIVAMQTAIDHMNEYLDALNNGSDIEPYIDKFENDYFELTGLANLYYQ